jgi:hypothetical protein
MRGSLCSILVGDDGLAGPGNRPLPSGMATDLSRPAFSSSTVRLEQWQANGWLESHHKALDGRWQYSRKRLDAPARRYPASVSRGAEKKGWAGS